MYLGNKPVATVRSDVVYNIQTDNLNTPYQVEDVAGNIVWYWGNREAFGNSSPIESLVDGSLFIFNLRFPGQWYDNESGLVQNGFRDYDPSLGRYMEVDPLGLSAGMNTYGYVGGNPLSGLKFALNVDANAIDGLAHFYGVKSVIAEVSAN